jgi:DNA-binding transcriptional MocR family regulator
MKTTTLYETISARIEHLISHGTYRIGDRIPSVRELSRQMKVSISTVMEAYRLLEDRSLIECRPQSGYYVKPSFPSALAEPETSNPTIRPTRVSINDLVMMVMQDTRKRELIPLGAAIPNPEVLPIGRLSRTLCSATRRYGSRSVSYEFAPGDEALRTQIAKRSLVAGCPMTPEELIITSGCQEAIVLSLQVLCKRGDTVAIESPTFYNFFQAIEVLGLRALEIPTHPRDGVCIDTLRRVLRGNKVRAGLFTPNFNNPLGSCMPDDRKRELVELFADRGIPLIEDDIYGDISYSLQRPKTAKAFDKTGNVLLCSSFSKTLAPGYRVGWIAPGKFRTEVLRRKLVSSLGTATPTQQAIAAFLAEGGYDRHLRKLRKTYARNAVLMAAAVSEYFPEGTKVTRPTGGQVLWAELPKWVDSVDLYEKALKQGIAIAPGPIFSSQRKYHNFVRLNSAMWSDRIKDAVARVGSMARGMKKR